MLILSVEPGKAPEAVDFIHLRSSLVEPGALFASRWSKRAMSIIHSARTKSYSVLPMRTVRKTPGIRTSQLFVFKPFFKESEKVRIPRQKSAYLSGQRRGSK